MWRKQKIYQTDTIKRAEMITNSKGNDQQVHVDATAKVTLKRVKVMLTHQRLDDRRRQQCLSADDAEELL